MADPPWMVAQHVIHLSASVPYTRSPTRPASTYDPRPEDGPTILQFGGGLFGRHNFGFVNEGFSEAGFRLLAFVRRLRRLRPPARAVHDRGLGDDGAALLDALGLDRVLVHGTSMGGMIAIAFAARHGERTIAACADVAFAKPDVYRKTLFRVAAHGRVHAMGRLLRPRDHAGRRPEVPRERGGQGHVRARPHRDRVERPLHGAPGLYRHGGDGFDAARPGDLRATADDERHLRHPLPSRASAVRLLGAADGGDEPEHHDTSSRTSDTPTS